jgi:predicted glutamine amidotransferase
MPPLQTMKNCWDGNSNGAGIMWSNGESVTINKGFLQWKVFEAFYREKLLDNAEVKNYSFVFHFRLATHGSVCAENTHPFPVLDDKPQDLVVTTDLAVAHNGIIPGCHDTAKVDTVQLIDSTLRPVLSKHRELLDNTAFCDLLYKATSSKFAFMAANGAITLIGNFIKAADGMIYSNEGYKRARFTHWDDLNDLYHGRNYRSSYFRNYTDDDRRNYDYELAYDYYVDKVTYKAEVLNTPYAVAPGECYVNNNIVAVSEPGKHEQLNYYLSGRVLYDGDNYFLIEQLYDRKLVVRRWLGSVDTLQVEYLHNQRTFDNDLSGYVIWVEMSQRNDIDVLKKDAAKKDSVKNESEIKQQESTLTV